MRQVWICILVLLGLCARAHATTPLTIEGCDGVDPEALERIIAANVSLEALEGAHAKVTCANRDAAIIVSVKETERASRTVTLPKDDARTRALGLAIVEVLESGWGEHLASLEETPPEKSEPPVEEPRKEDPVVIEKTRPAPKTPAAPVSVRAMRVSGMLAMLDAPTSLGLGGQLAVRFPVFGPLALSTGFLTHFEQDGIDGVGRIELLTWGVWTTLDVPVRLASRWFLIPGVGARVQRLTVSALPQEGVTAATSLARWQVLPLSTLELQWRALPWFGVSLGLEAGWLPQSLTLEAQGQAVRTRGGLQGALTPGVSMLF